MKHRNLWKITLTCLLALLLLLLPAACAAPAEKMESDFVFGTDGYAYAPAPFGSTREEVEEAMGSAMTEQGTNPHTDPFEYLSYATPEQNVQLSGPDLKCRVDAQFTEENGLFAITFNSAVYPEQREDFIEFCRTNFTALFGKPTEDQTSDTNVTILSWEDQDSGTVFMVSVTGESTENSGETLCRVALGAFEKWRYVEAGVGEWA